MTQFLDKLDDVLRDVAASPYKANEAVAAARQQILAAIEEEIGEDDMNPEKAAKMGRLGTPRAMAQLHHDNGRDGLRAEIRQRLGISQSKGDKK